MSLLPLLLAPFLTLLFSDGGGSGGGSGDGGAGDGDGGDGGDGSAGGGAGTNDDAAGLKSALDKERTRAKQAEKDLKAVQTKLADLEGKDKSDVERLTGERDALRTKADETEQRLRDATARQAVYDAAGKVNAISANAVYALVRDGLEFDDDGEPTNVDTVIAQAKKDEPGLFRASGGSGNGGERDADDTHEVKPGMDRLTHAYATQSKTAARAR